MQTHDGTVRGDFKLKTLEMYLRESIEKMNNGTTATISDALLEVMPDVVRTLRALAITDESTPTMRRFALEAILSIWARLMTLRLREDRAEISKTKWLTKRQQAAAEKSRAQADEKRARIEIARQQRKIARQLKKAQEVLQTERKVLPAA